VAIEFWDSTGGWSPPLDEESGLPASDFAWDILPAQPRASIAAAAPPKIATVQATVRIERQRTFTNGEAPAPATLARLPEAPEFLADLHHVTGGRFDRRSTISWWRSKRFSATTTARGAKNFRTAATTLRRRSITGGSILGPVVSKVQPHRALAPSFAACASSFRGAQAQLRCASFVDFQTRQLPLDLQK
jgi:hypothetical protein